MSPAGTPVANALSIDVEDYFHVSALAPHFPRDQWDSVPVRVEANVERLLEILDTPSARATFFTLGWVAERYPQMVQRIVANGHELASHGYAHLRATDQTQAEFRDDIVRAKRLLEDISGAAVIGYRAPSFSIST
ncbi:MAG: polysaccharide deacetylase family protein, partial [Burkholderiales bacterium]